MRSRARESREEGEGRAKPSRLREGELGETSEELATKTTGRRPVFS